MKILKPCWLTTNRKNMFPTSHVKFDISVKMHFSPLCFFVGPTKAMNLLICRMIFLPYKLLLNLLGSPGKPCLPGCPGRPGGPGNPGLPGIDSPVPGKPGSPWKPWGPGAPLTPGRPGRPIKKITVYGPYSLIVSFTTRYQGGNYRLFRTVLKKSFYITKT